MNADNSLSCRSSGNNLSDTVCRAHRAVLSSRVRPEAVSDNKKYNQMTSLATLRTMRLLSSTRSIKTGPDYSLCYEQVISLVKRTLHSRYRLYSIDAY